MIYYWCLSGIFVIALGLSAVRWAEDCHLAIVATLSFGRKNLPLRRELPQIAFWFLPAVIGSPITLYVLWTHPPGQSEPVGGAMFWA
jgi:hypothetical protein